MKLLATTNIVPSHGSIAIMDDVEAGQRVLDESFIISLILSGALVALRTVLVFVLCTCLLVTELKKVRR